MSRLLYLWGVGVEITGARNIYRGGHNAPAVQGLLV